MTATRSELQAWIDAYATPDAPDAQTLADFLGIELAPEPATPVGQRRRSPSGVEVVKTDHGFTEPWRKYRGRNPGPTWFADVEVADWEVITDAPLDEYGRQFGVCNACGEEAEADTECCRDGEVVPARDADGAP